MRMRTCVLVMMLGVAGGALAQEEAITETLAKRVQARGLAEGAGETAAEEAKLDALRAAVAKVCGTFINAQSETENYQILRDRVLEHPLGFGRIIRVVKGPDLIAGGDLTEITVEAEVYPAQFERQWAELAHILEREGNPRCVIIVLEDDNPHDHTPPATNGVVQSALEDFFLSKGVRLMDRGSVDAVKKRDLKLAAENGDVIKAAAAGAAFDAEVVILGKAEARQGDSVNIGGYEVKMWNVTLTLRAVETDSAAILISKTYTPEEPISSTHMTARQALIKFGKEIAPEVLSDLAKAWRERATAGRTIEMRIQPVSRQQFKLIEDALVKFRGVIGQKEGVRLRELINRVATVEVRWKYGLNQFADRVEALEISSGDHVMTFEITEQSANRIDVTVTTRRLPPPTERNIPASRPATSTAP